MTLFFCNKRISMKSLYVVSSGDLYYKITLIFHDKSSSNYASFKEMEVPLWCLGRQWTRLKTPKWTLERIPAILTRLLKALKKGSLMEDTERGQNTSIELYFLYWHLINVFVSHINVVYKKYYRHSGTMK